MGFEEAFDGDDGSLKIFAQNMRKFDQFFCDVMMGRLDYTLRFEVRGNGGRMTHCRVSCDTFERPEGVDVGKGHKARSVSEGFT